MKLEGIKAISTYLLLSESTIMDLILHQNLPAKKDQTTATYSAESGAIDKWIAGGKKPLAKKPKKPGPKKDKEKNMPKAGEGLPEIISESSKSQSSEKGVKAGTGGKGKVK